jgi:hypothetical protein
MRIPSRIDNTIDTQTRNAAPFSRRACPPRGSLAAERGGQARRLNDDDSITFLKGKLFTCLVVLFATLASNTPGLAQIGGQPKAAPKAMHAGADATAGAPVIGDVPSTLDEALAAAMEGNPDIVTAKAKVRLAEAELYAAKMEVARKIIAQWGKRETQALNVKRYEEADRKEPGSYAPFMIEAKASSAQVQAELRYLIGQATHQVRPTSDSGAIAKPLQVPKGPLVEKLRKALNTQTQMSFIETPLSDVVDYLKDLHGIEIQIDKDALSDDGIGTDWPVNVALDKMSLGAAIQLWDDKFKQLKLVVRDYGILVTTPERAEEQGYFPAVEFARLAGSSEAAAPAEPSRPASPKGSSERPKPPALKPVLAPPKK